MVDIRVYRCCVGQRFERVFGTTHVARLADRAVLQIEVITCNIMADMGNSSEGGQGASTFDPT